MTGPLDKRALEIFEHALDLNERERSAYLARACQGQPPLLAEIQSLLKHSEEAPTGFLEPASAEARLPAGMRLGEFQLEEEIGRGANAVVYRARQNSLDRDVAVKVMVGGQFAGDERRERFEREARIAASLSHPGVVPVISHGEHRGQPWFAMEWVRGHDLDRELKLQRKFGESSTPVVEEPLFLPPRRTERYVAAAASLVRDAAAALEHAHGMGLVHRDIKPSNMLLDPKGRIRLADFGIAKMEEGQQLTQTSALIGSLPYMSPEQARGRNEAVGPTSDVYSLGTVLYELLTLKRAHPSSDIYELIQARQADRVVPIRSLRADLPRDLCTICEKAMTSDVQGRYASAAEMEQDLARFLRFEAIHAKPAGFLARLFRNLRRHKQRVLTAALVLALALAALAWADSRAQAKVTEEALRLLAALQNETDWSELPSEQLVSARRRIAELGPSLRNDPQHAGLFQGLEGRFENLKASLRKTVPEEANQGLVQISKDPLNSEGYAKTLRAARKAQNFALIFPEAGELLEDELYQPVVSVAGVHPGGSPANGMVGYRRLDPLTSVPGPWISVGPLPLEQGRFPIGPVRIVVRVPGHGVREFTRMLAAGSRSEIRFSIHSSAEGDREWIHISQRVCRDNTELLSPLYGQEIVVEPFELDAEEVSIGEYMRFVAACPEAFAPKYLAHVVPGTADVDLPVTKIPWTAARDYAEWAGCRLPSHPEWKVAGRGDQSWLFPWGPGQSPKGNLNQPRPTEVGEPELVLQYLRDSAVAVHNHLGDVTPDGLKHLYGNATEWTESHGQSVDGEVRQMDASLRVFCGRGFLEGRSENSLKRIGQAGTGDRYAYYDRGFRVARSLEN